MRTFAARTDTEEWIEGAGPVVWVPVGGNEPNGTAPVCPLSTAPASVSATMVTTAGSTTISTSQKVRRRLVDLRGDRSSALGAAAPLSLSPRAEACCCSLIVVSPSAFVTANISATPVPVYTQGVTA